MMKDPVLFWTIVSALGQAVGALATAAAVITSLWIVLSERKPRLRVTAGMRMIVGGGNEPAYDVISIQIANSGVRRATCTAIGWKTGYFRWGPSFLKRQLALQNVAYTQGSAKLPLTLDPGEEAIVLQEVEAFRDAVTPEVRSSLFCRRLPWHAEPQATRIQIIVSLAAHDGVFTKVEPGLADFLATGVIADGAKRFNERAAQARQA